MEKLVVTRHKALYEWLLKNNHIKKDTKQIAKASTDDVKDKHVYGILPNWLACKAGLFTEVQLRLPEEARGRELSVEEVDFYVIKPRTYKITEVKE